MLSRAPEPLRKMSEQIVRCITDPGDVSVRSEKKRGCAEVRVLARHVIDSVRPSSDGELPGLVQQKAPSSPSELVEPTLADGDVPLSSAELFGSCAEVVADACRRDLLGEEPADVVEFHQLGQQATNGLRPGLGEISSLCARVVFSTSSPTGRRSVS